MFKLGTQYPATAFFVFLNNATVICQDEKASSFLIANFYPPIYLVFWKLY